MKFKRLYLDSAPLGSPVHIGDAGYDLPAYGETLLKPGIPTAISCGIAIEIPEGFVGLVCPRSGMRFKHRITTFGTGVIDSGYRGEMKVLLINHGPDFLIKHGDYVAQLVVVPVFAESAIEMTELSDSARGENGFGSTGLQRFLPGALFETGYIKE